MVVETVYESDEIMQQSDIDPRETAVLSAAAAGHPLTGSVRLGLSLLNTETIQGVA